MEGAGVPVKVQRPNCVHSSGVMWLPPSLTPPPCSLDSRLRPRLGGLTEFPPAAEARSVLFPVLRAPSCQTSASTGPCFPALRSVSPGQQVQQLRPNVTLLSRALEPRALITQAGDLFLVSLLTAMAVSPCAHPSIQPSTEQVRVDILVNEGRGWPASWGETGRDRTRWDGTRWDGARWGGVGPVRAGPLRAPAGAFPPVMGLPP